MNLPFTASQFLAVFAQYNHAIWPAQIVAYGLGLLAVGLAYRPSRRASQLISAILAGFWLWMGLIYHLGFFREINPAAILFGGLFVVQGLVWLWVGVVQAHMSFRAEWDGCSVVGGLFILYAMLMYPVIGMLLGHGYPQAPIFGVAPCPTTIFTFGLLLWTRSPVPKFVLVIPLLWSLIGAMAAVTLGIQEDIGLLIAGVVGTALLVRGDGFPIRPGHWPGRPAAA
ncbi:MAG: DUF6064 family protein [Chloroflexota bacterium]